MNTALYSIGLGLKRVVERDVWRAERRLAVLLAFRRPGGDQRRARALFTFSIPFISKLGFSKDAVGAGDPEDDDEDEGDLVVKLLAATQPVQEPIEKERKFLAGGNFKMNGDKKELDVIVKRLAKAKLDPNVEVFVSPPMIYMDWVKKSLPKNIALAAQNCYMKERGPYTGEVSPAMIKDVGGTWVIIGHSERRFILGETDKMIGEKICRALNDGLKVVACLGETREERDSGKTEDVIIEQLEAIASHCCGSWSNLVLAYEPVWAIGTGNTATPEQAQEVHCVIRCWVRDNVSECASDIVRIIYGGSVTKENCTELAKMPDIDGFLVGGASLKPEFVEIINCIEYHNKLSEESIRQREQEEKKKNTENKQKAKGKK